MPTGFEILFAIVTVVIAAAAAMFAWVQANIANSARKDALEAQREATEQAKKALEAAAESASAATRSADAAEKSTREQERAATAAEGSLEHQRRAADALAEQAELIREAGKPKVLWEFEALSDKSQDQKWRVINRTGGVAMHVQLGSPAGYDEEWLVLPQEARTLDAGEEIVFTFKRRYTSPSSAVVWVMWVPPDGSKMRKHAETIR
ncbi:hypothetical protein [Naasia lichenicola]|uniref:Uncharacterized protein n=1 Tax=Naasia lichenicola TaxID=2565933 RepID=A0A4S4FRS9_9MICO|nr:hypothetical protein [Naasia lichenicola]THG33001.1 hypothetical protein E6C64_01150 [Naasia lichenicola]